MNTFNDSQRNNLTSVHRLHENRVVSASGLDIIRSKPAVKKVSVSNGQEIVSFFEEDDHKDYAMNSVSPLLSTAVVDLLQVPHLKILLDELVNEAAAEQNFDRANLSNFETFIHTEQSEQRASPKIK